MPLRDFKSIQRAVSSFLESKSEVDAAYIFGSTASGRMRADSDVDIAVLVSNRVMRRDPFRYRLRLIGDLIGLLKRDDVDVILLNESPPLFGHRVLSRGN